MKTKKGFGLLEVLISGVIIILILSSLILIGRRALANSTYYEQRAQAIYLAQEYLEIVRQIRDSNWIDGNSDSEWNDFVYAFSTDTYEPADPQKTYHIEYDNDRYLLKSTPEFEPTTLGEVEFKRSVKVEKIGGSLIDENNPILPEDTSVGSIHPDINAIRVTAKVSWSFDGDHTISVSELLTNWRPNF